MAVAAGAMRRSHLRLCEGAGRGVDDRRGQSALVLHLCLAAEAVGRSADCSHRPLSAGRLRLPAGHGAGTVRNQAGDPPRLIRSTL